MVTHAPCLLCTCTTAPLPAMHANTGMLSPCFGPPEGWLWSHMPLVLFLYSVQSCIVVAPLQSQGGIFFTSLPSFKGKMHGPCYCKNYEELHHANTGMLSPCCGPPEGWLWSHMPLACFAPAQLHHCQPCMPTQACSAHALVLLRGGCGHTCPLLALHLHNCTIDSHAYQTGML